MNIFRSLMGKVWHDPNATEVVKISEGQLFLVREETIRSDRECIYNDAMATIRRVPQLDHHFQLVITRVYEDGDQELIEDEDETDEERTFLIGEELCFRTGETEGELTFIWRDIEGDVNEFYEFVARGTNDPTRAFFETCMYRAMYERKYKTSADSTQDKDLAEFIWQPPPPSNNKKGKARALKKPEPSSQSLEESISSSTSESQFTEAESEVQEEFEGPPAPHTDPNVVTYAGAPAVLYHHDADLDQFIEERPVFAQIVRRNGSPPFLYWLMAANGEHIFLFHEITSEMNQNIAKGIRSVTWNHISDGVGRSWCLRFHTEEDFNGIIEALTIALWEHGNQYSWAKLKAEDQDYARNANEDVEMRDVEDDSDEEDAVLDELEKEDDDVSETEDEDIPEDEEDQLPALGKGEKNSQLTVGYKGDRSYVVRGNNIGVFSHTGDHGSVKYHATIGKIAHPKSNRAINPKEVMLHEQDTKMVIMDDNSPNSLFELDIERGKIVEEWKVNDNVPVKHIAPDSKFAPMTHQQTLVGASGNALFRIDPRLSGDKLVDSQFKQYVSKNKFSGVTTTADGKLAVASEKGDIRLFDAIGKNAKTALPPLGDPIVGVDVTADGRWIVATTKTYLLLIDTLIGEGRYAGSLGFDRSFPANSKPIPRRLQLKAEHVAYMGHSVNFSPARFNTGEGQQENAIVTSTGEFVIAWDFGKVKKGFLDKYDIKKYEDHVVQDNFKFGDDKEIVCGCFSDVLFSLLRHSLFCRSLRWRTT
ncbi:VID27 cytoplasmic protein [Irpex rosettiformis]|uniref:VID27 cytoplasmic protein n=1 Tax=Irpex rosettiformis TaxID=378272 RepID=A0ACB8UES9_9APHY|nr:VID27 cytoplasmic protein [Irpex rosettiformis]